MAIIVNPASHLIYSQIVNVEGIEYFDFPQYPKILPQKDDIFITIGQPRVNSREIVTRSEELRIDMLSYRIYKNPHLWWVIALRNNLELVPSQLKFGQRIVVPSPNYVYNKLLQSK
jgi:hypothetical protein